MPFPNRIRYWNKVGVNRLMRRIARLPFGPFCLVEHVGRRSGTTYQTPIVAVLHGNSFIVALTYGTHADWYRNILAAGGCRIYWHRQWYDIGQIVPVSKDDAMATFPIWLQVFVTVIRVKDFIQLSISRS